MNIAYFRKSKFDRERTVQNVKKSASELGLNLLGSTDLPGGNGIVLHICNPAWMGNLIASDANLIGLLPCSVVVINKDDGVVVGVGSPTVLGSVSQNPAITQLASEANKKLKDLIHRSAGVEAMKPVGVKLYSTTTCPYCKMEAKWLTDKKIQFDEVHVDLNREEAEDMVKKTGQMGVPVTGIKYEDGEEEFVIGFDKPQLAQILETTQ